jgi:hypothetical protein
MRHGLKGLPSISALGLKSATLSNNQVVVINVAPTLSISVYHRHPYNSKI